MSEPTAPPPAPDEGVVEKLALDLYSVNIIDGGDDWYDSGRCREFYRRLARFVLERERAALWRVHMEPCRICDELIPMSECEAATRIAASGAPSAWMARWADE
jgi:hypothetical protein